MRLLPAVLVLLAPIALAEEYPRFSNYPKFLEVKTVISSTQLLALDATPVTLVSPTLSSSCIPILYSYAIDKPAGTAYAAIAAGDDMQIETSGSVSHISIETTGFLDQATRQRRSGRVGASFSPVQLTEAFGLALRIRLLGPITTGTSPLLLTITYVEVCNA